MGGWAPGVSTPGAQPVRVDSGRDPEGQNKGSKVAWRKGVGVARIMHEVRH
jgi:hypothetical protein